MAETRGNPGDLLHRLSAYARDRGITGRELARELGVPYNTLQKWHFFSRGKSARNPSAPHLERVREFLEGKRQSAVGDPANQVRLRTDKVKRLLLSLEDELRWFRDGDAAARSEFRRALDAADVGYVSSLLAMLSDEDRFQRWLALTTSRFQSFRGR